MDKERILLKLDEIFSYLDELEKIKRVNFENYNRSIEIKRACERLLQISIEGVIDVCYMMVSKIKLGLPPDEENIFKKLYENKVLTQKMFFILENMKGFRNVLVHKYGTIDNELVFEFLSDKIGDFERFKEEILKYLNKNKK